MPTSTGDLTVPQRDALTVRHLEDAADAIERALKTMPNSVESGFTGADAAALARTQRELNIMRAQCPPADPIAVMVPVGILQRCAQLVDDLADRQRADDPDDDNYLAGAGPDAHDAFARQLYAANRGEHVEWSNG